MPDEKMDATTAGRPTWLNDPASHSHENVAAPPIVEENAATAPPADKVIEPAIGSAPPAAESDMTVRRARYHEFFEFLRNWTVPVVKSPRWGFLLKESDWLRIELAPLDFLKVLETDYSAELLTILGLYVCVDDELRPATRLEGDSPLYVAINEDDLSVRFGTDNEFLFPMANTALYYALERNPSDCSQPPETLFIVDSLDAVEVLKRLDLPAISCEGLATLDHQDIEKLFDANNQNNLRWRYDLALLDFDVTRIANRPTAAIGEVIKRLADAADVYGVDPGCRFAVCRPSEKEFQVLDKAIEFKDSSRIRQLLQTWSTAAKDLRVHNWRTHFNAPAVSYSAAMQALASAIKRSDGLVRRTELIDALAAYRDAGREAVLQKFYQAVDRTNDPFIQIDLIAATGYAQDYLDNDPLIRAAEGLLADHRLPTFDDLHDELFEKRQKSLTELRRIRRDSKSKR